MSFPADWTSDEYELTDEVNAVYIDAFRGSIVKQFSSKHKISIVGKTTETYRDYRPTLGKRFHLSANTIFCDDEKKISEDEKITISRMENGNMQENLNDDISIENKWDNYVFISYSSKNQQIADSVRILLLEHGVNCWMAPYDIPAGSRYAYVINDALENCSCLLLLLTNASQMSQFVEREIERAITYKKPILPMQLEDLELNSGFKFYIGNSQIIAVPEVKGNSPEFCRILSGIQQFVKSVPAETYEPGESIEENEQDENQDGLIVTKQFGSYPYYEDAQKKAIEWIVLKQEDNKMLLLSKYGIDLRRYHEDGNETSWEMSGLRRWLNDTFIEDAFDEAEKARICSEITNTTTNLFYNTGNEAVSIDKIFILGAEEIKEYLTSKELCVCKPTPYSKEKGVFINPTNGGGLWWIRTPGEKSSLQSFVNVAGEISYAGCYYQRGEIAVRPAMWVTVF